MQSKVVALLAPEGSLEAALLVRRGNGQFSLQRIDARVAHAARVASAYTSNKALASTAPELSAA